jgi:hypothetical protein
MMSSLSGRELARWQAYERKTGPLDDSWRDEQLATLGELLQQNTSITGAVGQGKKNPAPKPKPIIRPWQLFEKAKQEQANSVLGGNGELVLEKGEVNPF